MNKSFKRGIWIVVIVFLIIGFFHLVINSKNRISARMGGKLLGRSHKDGGIRGVIDGSRKTVELEEGEYIITANVNNKRGEYICEGTLPGISSAVNIEGGGVGFDKNGHCKIKH